MSNDSYSGKADAENAKLAIFSDLIQNNESAKTQEVLNNCEGGCE